MRSPSLPVLARRAAPAALVRRAAIVALAAVLSFSSSACKIRERRSAGGSGEKGSSSGSGSWEPKGGSAANPVVVKLSYGSEKKAFLTEAIQSYHAGNPRTSAGRPIRIEAVAEGSAESMEAILAGKSDAAVWSPASSLWVDVLNDRWREKSPAVGGGSSTIAPESASIVVSPVVVAMWEPMAKALGWPDRPIGWKTIADFAAAEGGWNRFGHPEWGDFQFGHTHPLYSNSGAIALVASTYAGAGKTRDLTVADVSKASGFVKRVEANVVHYGRSTGFFADSMFRRGPAYLSAAVLYENLVVESSLDPQFANKPFNVVAIYPSEGTFWADHPFVILNRPEVTPEVREAAAAFKTFLLTPAVQKNALERHGFRPVDTSIPLGAPIDAAHGLDPAQPKNVLPNPPVAVTRRILESFDSVKRPVSVTFVLDTSGSMRGDPLQQVKAGARVFLDSLPASDRVRALLFSTQIRWISKQSQPVSAARATIAASIDGAFAQGNTALYDAILEASEPGDEPKGAVRAVVVLTDGEDTSSRTTLDDLLARLSRERSEGEGERAGPAPPRIFTIAYGSEAKPEVLKKIAEVGGGAYFAGTPKDIARVYAELASFF